MRTEIFHSDEEFQMFLLEEENQSSSSYVSVKTRHLGRKEVTSLSRVFFEDNGGKGPHIPYDGVPYVVLGFQQYDCHQGKCRTKKKQNQPPQEQDHGYAGLSRTVVQPTKKLGCTAMIKCRKIIKFPEYQLEGEDSKKKRLAVSTRLKAEFIPGETLQQYEIVAEMSLEHTSHITGDLAGLGQKIDKRLAEKIKELVEAGACRVSEVKPALYEYSKMLNPEASQYSRRYFPNNSEIYSHIYRAVTASRFSSDDQECVQKMVHDMKTESPEDHIFFRPASCTTEEHVQSMLFVHQTAFQRKMLHKYGQEVVAMDATYQTSKYDLSTFFVCVATNIGYQIVATIVIDKETTSQIEEGLRMLKKWNPGWTPKYFVCDFDIREITAIERVFDNVLVYLCKFHMEQAWDRWLGAKKHGVVRWKTDITDQLRHIAQASDEEGYMNEVEALRNHDAYKDKDSLKFRNWVEKKWLSSSKRWVKCFRQEMVNIRINTTNGVERMHQELKRNYLNKYSHGGTLESQLRVIMTRFLPDLERKYIENNTLGRADFRKYDDDVPIFLHDRPAKFVRHCLARLNSNLEVNENETSEYFRESFLVRNLESGTENTVTFIDRLPDCSCSDWKKYKWPCKHILFIISNNEELHWSQLNSDYTEQPCFVLDYHIECVDLNNTSDTNEEDLPKENETETLRNCCITSLKNIQSGIYCITDMDTLGNLNTKLREIEELSNSGKDYLGSLPLRKRKKKKEKQVQQQKRVRIDKQDDDSVIIDGVFDVPLTDTMDNAVLEIWNQPADDLPLLQVGPYVVTRRSFHYIRTTLSDDVIDASLAMMVKGRNIYHINCITASAIFNGREDIHHNLSQVNLHMFDACIGAVNEGGSHWSLVVIVPAQKTVIYLNPLGELSSTKATYKQYWYEFLTSRYRCGLENSPPENWTLETLEHSKQLDGNSCGVYVIKFAENYIHKRSLCFSWTRADIYEERKRIAKTILSGGTGDISAQENESVTPDLPEVTPDLPEVTQDLPKVTPDLHEVTPDLPEVTTEPAEARQEKPSKVKCYQLRGLKPKRKMSSFIYPSISKKKRELHGEAVTKETRKETRKLQLKDIQDCWSSVANHLKDIVSCTEKSCEHARHHAFIVDPVNYASRQRKLYGYGSDAYEEAAVEWFQDKMPSLIKYDLHPRTPATSARISTMEGVHKQSRLYQIFVELGLSIEYLYGVLLKESMAYCLCAELKMAYEQADHLCMKTEFDRTKRPKT